jgi:anti-anti-sigma factor
MVGLLRLACKVTLDGPARKTRLAMVAPIFSHGLQSEQVGNAIVVTFTDPELLDELRIQRIGERLLRMAARLGGRHVVVNLSGVERLSTMMLGKLITLHKMLRSIGGRLIICRIDPSIYEIFRIFNLRRLIPIYAEEEEALEHCRPLRPPVSP